MTNLKERILSGEAVHGCWINLGSPVSAEIVGRAGFDWVLIDLEHGAGNDAVMYLQLQVLANTGATALVRTAETTRPQVQRILDAGAGGIMFPQVQNASAAAEAVSMMYYPPRGTRGMARMVRATGFGKNANDYIRSLEKNVIGIVQIENVGALREIAAIAATPGADVLFVGPSDLSLALGIFGQFDHPLYQEALRQVASAARDNGKATGVLLQHPGEYDLYYKLGYRFLACGADASFVMNGADDLVRQMNLARSGAG